MRGSHRNRSKRNNGSLNNGSAVSTSSTPTGQGEGENLFQDPTQGEAAEEEVFEHGAKRSFSQTLEHGYSESTKRSYAAEQVHFVHFCLSKGYGEHVNVDHEGKATPKLPISREIMEIYVAWRQYAENSMMSEKAKGNKESVGPLGAPRTRGERRVFVRLAGHRHSWPCPHCRHCSAQHGRGLRTGGAAMQSSDQHGRNVVQVSWHV